jgi:hypothetical protein
MGQELKWTETSMQRICNGPLIIVYQASFKFIWGLFKILSQKMANARELHYKMEM